MNEAVDRDRERTPRLWVDRGGGRFQSVSILLDEPVFDTSITHSSTLPVARELVGDDLCFEEHSVMIREPVTGTSPTVKRNRSIYVTCQSSTTSPMSTRRHIVSASFPNPSKQSNRPPTIEMDRAPATCTVRPAPPFCPMRQTSTMPASEPRIVSVVLSTSTTVVGPHHP